VGTTAETLEKAPRDNSEEVKIMAAWTLVKLGQTEAGLGCLGNLLTNGTTCERKLHNVLDWMEEDAVPLVREYLQSKPDQAKNILGKIAEDHGIDTRRKPSRRR
jgi:N-sulfoglucosamine sulfohydrolase